jgi:hypothetical protein
VRLLLSLIVLVCLAGCGGEYSKVPDPTGEWVPANPPRVTGDTTLMPRPTRLNSAGQGG